MERKSSAILDNGCPAACMPVQYAIGSSCVCTTGSASHSSKASVLDAATSSILSKYFFAPAKRFHSRKRIRKEKINNMSTMYSRQMMLPILPCVEILRRLPKVYIWSSTHDGPVSQLRRPIPEASPHVGSRKACAEGAVL